MAYNYAKLYMVSTNLGASGHKTFAYESADVITGAGYFPTDSGMKDGDLLELRTATVVSSETTAMVLAEYVMKANATTGVLTAVAINTSTTTITADNTEGLFTYNVTATLAEINAGKVIIAAKTGKKIRVVNYIARVVGAFAANTSVDLQSGTTGTKVTAIARAGLTDGAILMPSSANTTLGAGFGANLETGESLKVVNVGTAATTATSITFTVTAAYV